MWAKVLLGCVGAYVLAAAAWIVAAGVQRQQSGTELLNVACDPTRELWRELNAAFIRDCEQRHSTAPTIRMSHGGSGSQARAIVDGLDADIASLALWTDTDAVRKAGLLDANWEEKLPNRSLPYLSTIVLVVRKGNPKNIRDWTDLARGDVKIVTPNPKTSGNGKWSFLALWGSVIWRGGSDDDARAFVQSVYSRVPVLDPAARGSTMTFASKGIGDVHLTWENEAHLEVQESDGALEIVYPHRADERPLSILAEPHLAIVDKNVDRKGTRELAEAYVRFLYTEPAQEIIARNFHRPMDETVFARHRDLFPEMDLRRATSLAPEQTWDAVRRRFFAEGGEFDQLYQSKK
ncbi:MAG TPA: sulfate ABC transporter substrate-binding protein [Gemmataceae bacterium]|jgi:sulfate transport system substrate-binding protein